LLVIDRWGIKKKLREERRSELDVLVQNGHGAESLMRIPEVVQIISGVRNGRNGTLHIGSILSRKIIGAVLSAWA
jgi:hypothetical protein